MQSPSLPTSAPDLFGIPARIAAMLERKGQVILYGPPGTGKTFHAEQTARELAAHYAFGKPFSTLNQAERRVVLGHEGGEGLVRLCSFHPAYGYEDFLEGYRPQPHNGQMLFTLRDGLFKRLCQEAARDPQRRYYLLIDEINRGDIPRIFGELLTLLEKEQRGRSLLLPLTGMPFHVPANLYLLGTMNTSDRSITLLDAALRRRFAFLELMPDYTVLEEAVIAGLPLAAWLSALNQRIRRLLGPNARSQQIGHAYFLEAGSPVCSPARFSQIVSEEIVPQLEAACNEDYALLSRLLGKGLIDSERAVVRLSLPEKESLLPELLRDEFAGEMRDFEEDRDTPNGEEA